MRKFFGTFVLIILVLIMCFSFTGCKCTNPNSTKSTILVLGAHKNFPQVPLNCEEIYNEIYDTAYKNGSLSVFVIDGNPFMYSDYSIESVDKALDTVKKKQIAKQNTSQIILETQKASAKTAEFDTLSAITKAGGNLQSAIADEKIMIICDSGFSTAGYLNFASTNLIDADVEKLVQALEEKHAIPNLEGITIQWYGMGQVNGEQGILSADYKYKLKHIWTAILNKSGAKFNIDTADVGSKELETELPDVSTIPIINDTLNIDTVSADTLAEPIKFDETTLKFVGDKADYIDEESAMNALKPIAEYLINNKSTKVVVIGTTASAGTVEGCKVLSDKRAEKCKESLIQLGANEEQIVCRGLGRQKCSFRIDDTDSNGDLIEEYASKNRAIYILDINSAAARGIL